MDRVDPAYYLVIISLLIGWAVSFQRIYETYKKDSFRALTTISVLVYFLSRGVAPACLFVFLYSSHWIESNLIWWAVACGTGFEIVLRSQLSIRRTQDRDGNIQEILTGPLDLLRWYETLLLDEAAPAIGEQRKQFIENYLSNKKFIDLCKEVLNNIPAWPRESTRDRIEHEIKQLQARFEQELAVLENAEKHEQTEEIDQRYCLKLGYKILDIVGQKGFKTLCLPAQDVVAEPKFKN